MNLTPCICNKIIASNRQFGGGKRTRCLRTNSAKPSTDRALRVTDIPSSFSRSDPKRVRVPPVPSRVEGCEFALANESRGHSSPKILPETVTQIEIHSTHTNQRRKQFSNRNIRRCPRFFPTPCVPASFRGMFYANARNQCLEGATRSCLTAAN